MTSLGFLRFADARFSLTETARAHLLPESPFYWGGVLRRIREVPVDCRQLLASLRGGAAASEARLDAMWKAPAPPPEVLVDLTHAMHAHSFAMATRTIAAFAITGSLLDVAGGSGSYSIAAALHDPTVTSTVLDLAPVCAVAASYAAKHGVGARVATVAADMFTTAWPEGHDAILLADIFHDWDDRSCRQLADRAFAALPPRGRVLLHEMLLDHDKLGPPVAAAYSMLMVYVTQGRQRTAGELRAILEGAGFVEVRVIPTANGFGIVEGTKQ